MKLDEIKTQIALKLSCDHETWNNLLNNTQPPDYSCNHWKVDIDPEDIHIDIPEQLFLVNDGYFASNIRENQNPENKDINYNKAFTAKGKFEIDKEFNIKLDQIDIDIQIDIF